MVNTYLKGQCFFLKTDMMYLKWILDEPMEDALSPANEPSFMKRVIDYLLGRAPKDRIDN